MTHFSFFPCGTFLGGRQVTQVNLPETALIIGPLCQTDQSHCSEESLSLWSALGTLAAVSSCFGDKPRIWILTRHSPW